jgi:hypothetical protein
MVSNGLHVLSSYFPLNSKGEILGRVRTPCNSLTIPFKHKSCLLHRRDIWWAEWFRILGMKRKFAYQTTGFVCWKESSATLCAFQVVIIERIELKALFALACRVLFSQLHPLAVSKCANKLHCTLFANHLFLYPPQTWANPERVDSEQHSSCERQGIG